MMHKIEFRDGAVYSGEELLGEYEVDGKFVPSRLLLSKPVAFQKQVDKFVKDCPERLVKRRP